MKCDVFPEQPIPEKIAVLGENIMIGNFCRFEIGK